MCAFVEFDLVSLVLCQDIGWEVRLRNDVFCVEWGTKPQLNQSVYIDCFYRAMMASYYIETTLKLSAKMEKLVKARKPTL